jgi:hypothetical protein
MAAVGIVFAAAFLILLACFSMLGFRNNEGLGPDWDCAPAPNSEAVCVKKVPRAPRGAQHD